MCKSGSLNVKEWSAVELILPANTCLRKEAMMRGDVVIMPAQQPVD